jgi:uncharacterized membrane protein
MDDIAGVLLLVFVVVVLPWLLLLRSRHLRQKAQQEFDLRWSDMTSRVYAVERAIDEIRSSVASKQPMEAHASRHVTPLEHTTSAALAPKSEPAHQEETSKFETVKAAAESMLETSAAGGTRPEATSRKDSPLAQPTIKVDPEFARPQHAPPSFASVELEPSTWFGRLKGGFDLEEALGTNWLNKIGVIILVFGIAFFLAYQLRELGPAGKVTVGFVVSAALLGGGIFLGRKPGYVVLARAGLGGGWALAFFTSYAMYHVQAAKVLSSQGADLVLMAVVAASMVAHSLRYRSQLVTGLAFLLAYSTVTISHVTVYSLSAGVVLSLALVVIVLRMHWYELEVLGLAAAYLNHFYWLYQIIEPMHGHKHPFSQFVPSAAILISYWLIFRISYILRKPKTREQERIATAAALLNSFGLLGLFKYQSLHPEWAFYALLALGAAEICMALYARVHRRIAFIVLATVGVTLLFASAPFRFAGMNVSILWVAGTEALLFVGIATKEQVFRRLSFIAATATTIQMLSVDTARIIGIRADDAIPGRILPLGVALLVAAIIYYVDSVYVLRRWRNLFDEIDVKVLRLLSYGGLLLAAAGLWIAMPGAEASPAWACAALFLGFISMRALVPDLKIQGDVLALVAFIRALTVNLHTTSHWGHVSQRFITVGICAAALYVSSRINPYKSFPVLRPRACRSISEPIRHRVRGLRRFNSLSRVSGGPSSPSAISGLVTSPSPRVRTLRWHTTSIRMRKRLLRNL